MMWVRGISSELYCADCKALPCSCVFKWYYSMYSRRNIYTERERERACSHLLYRESVYKEALFIFLWISAYSRWILVCWWRYRTGLCHYNSTLCLPPSHIWCCPLKYTYFFISFWWNRRNCCYLYSFENVEENFLCIALYKELKDAIESYLWIPCKYIMSSFWGS